MDKKEILKSICEKLNENVDDFEVTRLEDIHADLYT